MDVGPRSLLAHATSDLVSAERVWSEASAAGLTAFGPDLVVLSGGTAALSEQVEAHVAASGFAVRRVSGSGRTATAAAWSALVDELASPFAADADVDALTARVDALTDRVADAEADAAALTTRVTAAETAAAALTTRVTTAETAAAALTTRMTAAEARAAALETLLAGVSRSGTCCASRGLTCRSSTAWSRPRRPTRRAT